MPFTGIRITEEAQDRLSKRGRHVHRPAIAANNQFASSKSSEKVGQRWGGKADNWNAVELLQNLFRLGVVPWMGWIIKRARRPQQNKCKVRPMHEKFAQQFHKSFGRPALLRLSCTDVYADHFAIRR